MRKTFRIVGIFQFL